MNSPSPLTAPLMLTFRMPGLELDEDVHSDHSSDDEGMSSVTSKVSSVTGPAMETEALIFCGC